MKELKIIEFANLFPNNTDPENSLSGCGTRCSSCEKLFSYWDSINRSPEDEDVLCAKCKGIEIKLKYPIK